MSVLNQEPSADDILTGEVVGIYRETDDNTPVLDQFSATLVLGTDQVRIPRSKMTTLDMTALNRQQHEAGLSTLTLADTANRYLRNRIGSEIDFVVTGEEHVGKGMKVIYGDRVAAMSLRRKEWFQKDDSGNYIMAAGVSKKARVVNVAKRGIRVELSGVETFIDNHDLFWDPFNDTKLVYHIGDKVSVLIKEFYRNEADGSVTELHLSVKELYTNPRDTALELYPVGGTFKGIVKQVKYSEAQGRNMYFVTLPGGVIVACRLARKLGKEPLRGDDVVIVITNCQKQKRNLYGQILQFEPHKDDR